MASWVAWDLDGTLAQYPTSDGSIGAPIGPSVERVKEYLSRGREVRIFTARVSVPSDAERAGQVRMIEAWCEKHLGRKLPVTCSKDYAMSHFYDDRCVQVVVNTGELMSDVIEEKIVALEQEIVALKAEIAGKAPARDLKGPGCGDEPLPVDAQKAARLEQAKKAKGTRERGDGG